MRRVDEALATQAESRGHGGEVGAEFPAPFVIEAGLKGQEQVPETRAQPIVEEARVPSDQPRSAKGGTEPLRDLDAEVRRSADVAPRRDREALEFADHDSQHVDPAHWNFEIVFVRPDSRASFIAVTAGWR